MKYTNKAFQIIGISVLIFLLQGHTNVPNRALTTEYIYNKNYPNGKFPTLEDLITLAEIKTYSSFDRFVRGKNFEFAKKEKISKTEIRYTYEFKFQNEYDNTTYTNRCVFTDYGDNKPLISFMTASEDLINKYKKPSLLLKGFKESSECKEEVETTVKFCYESENYSLILRDTKQFDNKTSYRSYSAGIFKK